jgi:hypothetical protein
VAGWSSAADYAREVGGSLTGFFWLTQRAIAEMAARYGGHVVSVLATLGDVADPGTPAVLAQPDAPFARLLIRADFQRPER